MRRFREERRCAVIAAAVIAATVATGSWMGWAAVSAAPSKRSTWGQILIFGGEEEGRRPTRFVAELYDPVSNRFAPLPPVMNEGRNDATATVITVGPNAGKVLVAGGFNESPFASTELYDPATDTFTQGPDMRDARSSHTATVITLGPNAGKILIVGGDLTDLYDPFANAFARGPAMYGGRWDHTATVIASGPNAGKVLIVGGWRVGVRNLASTELYDPRMNTFVQGPAMNGVREDHTATIISSGPNVGKILIAGGWGPYENHRFVPLASTELYDPKTNTFAPSRATAAMKIPRGSHTATLISSGPNAGKILIAGGQWGINDALSSTELYDPATNTFAPGPAMHSSRSQHIAMTIASGPNAGKILIAGGFGIQEHGKHAGHRKVWLASTELYDPATNTFAPGPFAHGPPGTVVAVQLPPAPRGEVAASAAGGARSRAHATARPNCGASVTHQSRAGPWAKAGSAAAKPRSRHAEWNCAREARDAYQGSGAARNWVGRVAGRVHRSIGHQGTNGCCLRLSGAARALSGSSIYPDCSSHGVPNRMCRSPAQFSIEQFHGELMIPAGNCSASRNRVAVGERVGQSAG